MSALQIFLNGEQVDLSSDSPIGLTFQINNLADVKNQNSNTSNQFNLPLTQTNRRILGFPDDIRITTDLPYTQFDARIIQDGIEIVPYGIGRLQSADDSNAAITILSGNIDFFDSISEQVYDMGDSTKVSGKNKPFLPYQHTWNVATAVASRKNTEGYIYPVIDYGKLPQIPPYTVNVRQLRPAFFLKTAIDLIVKQTGYKATGDILNDELYNKIIIPFANDRFEHGADYENQPDELGMQAFTTVDQASNHYAISDPYGKGIFNFGSVISDPSGQFNGNTFTASAVQTAEVTFIVPKFYFQGHSVGSSPSNINLIIYLHTPSEGDLQLVTYNYDLVTEGSTRVPGTSGGGKRSYNTFGSKTLSAQVDLLPGYQISCRWEFFNDRPENFILYNGASLTIKSNNTDVLFGQQVQCEKIFPDISQKDLLKDTLQRFAIICQTDNTNRTVTFATFKDIVKRLPLAKNWTDKCLNNGKSNTFSLGDTYAQVNNLLYKTDDAITAGYADDVININNKNLPASVDLFTSQFSPSLNTPFIGGFTAQIKKIDPESEGTDFTIGTSPRVLVDNKVNLFATNQTVTFTDGSNNMVVNDVISCPYFYKPQGQFSLMWKDMPNSPGLRSVYYKWLEKILKDTKVVSRYFLLTPRDIVELDLLTPVYLEQDNAYFYIKQVGQWQKGKACKVDLVKLGEI